MSGLKKIIIVSLILLVVTVPFVFREKGSSVIATRDCNALIIITPHNEGLRREYTIAFKKWYKAKTGKEANIDWRYQGGGRDAARYIESMFSNNFRLFWTNELRREWNAAAASAFCSRSEKMLDQNGSIEVEVSNAFFNSNVGCDVDILFGGGMHESENQAEKGNLVPCDLLITNPEMFCEDTIPEYLSGNRLWDGKGRWFGGALSAFGIIYNKEAIQEDGLEIFPETWMDIGRPEFFKKLAIVDPTKSSSTQNAFIMLIQQQMQLVYNELKESLGEESLSKEDEKDAISNGWINGLCLIQKIIANGRYFTESATRPMVDVSAGNCLAGIAVDFYGFSEAQHLENRSGSKRFKFVMPCGGGAPTADPIGVFRGAPHPLLAREFVEFVLSIDGQKILDFNLNTPGGPEKTTIRKVPILKTIYEAQYAQYRCDPSVDPYKAAALFTSHDEWTNDISHAIAMIIRLAFIDLNYELSDAMQEIIQARKNGRIDVADKAYNVLSDFSDLSMDQVRKEIIPILVDKNIMNFVGLQNRISEKYRQQYLKAYEIARSPQLLEPHHN